jgi:antirestriction protein ArdC
MPESQRQSFNIHQCITDSIVAAIEAGAGPVQMPWHQTGTSRLPTNALTGRRYRGVNVIALWAAAASRGFATERWATYRQWRELGAQVRRGEKASTIVFYKQIEVDEPGDDGDESRTTTRLVARASSVFNANQVDGYASPAPSVADPVAVVERADAFVAHTGAAIYHGGDMACYSIVADLVQMPARTAFVGTATATPTESYYGVLFHELTHWSGAEHRLARDLFGRFGSDAYAMEELVAELGAAFLCAELGIASVPRPDHAAYIGHWLGVLKADNRAIFSAASKAAAAHDYLLALSDTAVGIP